MYLRTVTRRYPQAELEPKLIGDPLLAPRWIFVSHAPDQPAKLHGNARAAWSGLVPPEHSKRSMNPSSLRSAFR